MSARRQSSTTSLARYARTTSPDPTARNFDFCNAFWGVGDGGVDVLFARMRGAARTMEELRNFWKERATIEEDYAKRLAKLAKMSIGKDEIGELRNSIDTLRLETDKQAGFHSQLAQQIRTDLEGQVGAFVSKQQHHKKVYQAAIEKEFKVKQTREQHASKARDKYESDCLRINSYTAQSTLVQGKDLEKIHLKLERAQQTVQVNENDYAQFTRVLQETMHKWEQDWKAFCDTCQDLEEERTEFMKDNMWAYANAVSTVCVSDDESCEKMRLALEQLEPEKDMENFVRDYGTGNAIPESPVFVNYANTDAPPVSSTRIVTRPANYVRSTQRSSRSASLPQDPSDEPYDDTNHAGVGAGVSGGPSRSTSTDPTSLSRSGTRRSSVPPSQTNGVNGHVSPSRDPLRRQSAGSALVRQPTSAGDPVDPTVSNTQLVIGDRAWDVDPSKDPQHQKASQARTSPPVGEQDPLVKQMAELNTAAAASGTARRNTLRRDVPLSSVDAALATPSATTSSPHAYRNSAEVVVGAYPLAQAPSRSASPNPPKAALVAPPPPSIPPPASHIPVEQVVSGYQRPFPGEPRSRANSYVGPPPVMSPNQDPSAPRPTSRAGYPGVGTQSVVPRPVSPAAKGPSPTTVQTYNRGGPPHNGSLGSLHRGMSVSHRPVTPTNPVGIALGPDGRVVHDMMAVQPARAQASSAHYVQPAGPPPPPPSAQSYGGGYHETSRALTLAQQQVARNEYGVVAGNPYGSGAGGGGVQQQQPQSQSQSQQYAVAAHPAPQHPTYNDGGYHAQAPPPPPPIQTNYGAFGATRPTYHPPQQQQQPPPPQAQQQQLQSHPHPHQQSQSVIHAVNPTTQPGQQLQHAHQQQQQQQRYVATTNNAVYRPTSPGMGRSPSPAPPRGQAPPPTGTYTDDGRPILFYVKALYDYSATIDEEFDFQAGDIIAVTDTPEDGWWSGELLDDTRRQAGRHVFPSNFVCLF